ncbi:MAG: hypothetical protein ACRDRS_02065 [Pseudonocardiaceae bacterium]
MGIPELAYEESAVHRRITDRLNQLVPTDSGIALHPYLRRHLVEHAARGGVLDDEYVPAGLLPCRAARRAADRAGTDG